MGYLIKATVGMALFIGGIVLFDVKLLQLLDIGTCASGNTPYEISRPCPEGTGTNILLLMGGIFGSLIGAGIFAFRGEPPWAKGRRSWASNLNFGVFAWGAFFTSTGAVLMIKTLGDDSLSAGSDLGGKITGITFLVMGVPALLFALWGLVKGLGGRDERPAATTAGTGGGLMGRMTAGMQQAQAAGSLGSRLPWGSTGTGGKSSSSSDQIGKLERLQRLREQGAINDSEFEREKAKILAGG
jgi:putative oligomerization/nucleic acid binding protein